MAKLNILHLGKYHPPFHGGIENAMADLMLEQSNAGHQVRALVHHHQAGDASCEDHRTEGVVLRVRTFGALLFVPLAPLFGWHLRRVIREFKPDILHMHMPNVSCFWALFLPSARKIPWVIHWHSDVVGAAPDWRIKLLYPFYRLFEKALLKKSARVIVTSPPYLKSSLPLKEFIPKCHVIPLGVRSVSESVLTPPTTDVLQLLMIGRFTYYKGHKLLLEAVAVLVQQGVNVHLTLVGRGELESALRQQCIDLGITNTVTFMGGVSDQVLQQQLKSCDLLCLPSIERTEAFGVVLLEAMRAGKPCLVSDVPGSAMSWVVEHDVNGVVVPTGNVLSLVSAIKHLAERPDKLAQMGHNARQRFSDHFTSQAVSHQVELLYRDVLNLRSG